jgi:hypothetical protein
MFCSYMSPGILMPVRVCFFGWIRYWVFEEKPRAVVDGCASIKLFWRQCPIVLIETPQALVISELVSRPRSRARRPTGSPKGIEGFHPHSVRDLPTPDADAPAWASFLVSGGPSVRPRRSKVFAHFGQVPRGAKRGANSDSPAFWRGLHGASGAH